MARNVDQEARQRAGNRCEYCRRPQDSLEFQFPIDHVIARQHSSDESLENLALACTFCNRHKGPNIAGIDPRTGQLTRLFHPRRDRWEEHFALRGALLIGLTDVGRTTIAVLAMNHPDQQMVRRALLAEGLI